MTMPPRNARADLEKAKQANDRKKRLKASLVQKIKAQCLVHGATKLNKAALEYIEAEVDAVLGQGAMQERDLVRIEKEARRLNGSGPARPKPTAAAAAAAAHAGSGAASKLSMVDDGVPQAPSTPAGVSSMSTTTDEWAVLQEYETRKHEEEERRRRELERAKREATRRALDEQRKEAERRKLHDVDSESRFAREESEIVRKWREDERRKEQERLEKNMREKAIRDEQLAANQQAREEEARKRREDEARQLADAARQMQLERERELAKRKTMKEEFKRVMEANEKYREWKMGEKQRQIEEDIRFQNEYNAMLDAQEAARHENLRQLAEKQKRRYEIGMKVQSTVAERAAEDERRARMQQAEYERKNREEDERRRQKLARETEATLRTLDTQMEERRNAERRRREEERRTAEQLEREAREYEENERRKMRERKTRDLAHQQLLKGQIKEHKEYLVAQKKSMNETERALNNAVLSRALDELSPSRSSQPRAHSPMSLRS